MEGIDVTEPAPFLQLLGGVVGITFALIRIGKWSLTLFTITLPSSIYHVLHYSLTLRLSFPILLLCLILCGIGIMLGLRYGYWNRYEKYRGDPIHKNENAYNFHPDVAAESTDEDRSGFHWYLDEFLQAIRIFGFLERPVFHELARHLQTRRLVAGEVLPLDKDTSFYIVVEGHVQVFAPIENKLNAVSTEYSGSDIGNGYQLINEVVSGGTLSSLFTILRLFTENVKLGFKFDSQPGQNNADEGESPPATARPDLPRSALSSLRQPKVSRGSPATVLDAHSFNDSHISPLNTPPRSDLNESFLSNVSSNAGHESAPISPLLSAIGSNSGPSAASLSASASHIHSEEHRSGSVARATVDTTLAVLPAEAFRRLTSKYPSAVAHIVQVILTRLARVTFHTAHQYLGLTREVMKTEQAINEYGKVFLPSTFYEKSAIETLWRRFPPSQTPAWQPSNTSSSTAAKTSSQQTTTAAKRPVNMLERKLSTTGDSFQISPVTRHQNVGPGDLFSMVESAIDDIPMDAQLQTSARRSLSVAGNDGEVDTAPLDLREQVMNCIASSIGLTQPVIDEVPGVLASPSLVSQSSSNPRGSYDAAFSRLSRLDAVTASEDSESVSQSASTHMSSSVDRAENGVEIRHFPAGTVLVHAGEQDAGLFYVIDGFIDIMLPLDELDQRSKPKSRQTSQSFGSSLSTPRPTNDLSSPFTAEKSSPRPSSVGNALDDTLPFGAYKRNKSRIAVEEAYRRSKQHEADSTRSLYTIGRGGIAGYLSSLLGVPSYVDVVAKTDVYVGFLPVRALERLVEKRNHALLTLSKRLLSLLPNLIIHIDAALDWQQVDAGQVIFREGDVSDSFYIVINGRLRAITERRGDGSIEIVSEYSQGDSAGELDMITKSPRTKTLHSIRDSEVARMPTTLFNAISIWHPPITIQISRIIARRVRREMDERQRNSLLSLPKHISGVNDLGRSTTNFKTVALLPTTAQVPIIDFARRLQETFAATITGSTVFLNQSSVMQALGKHAFKRMGKLKLAGWLANQEQNHRLVLYVVDTTVGSLWAQTSIRQADCILLVGFGDDPRVGEFERLLLSIKTTARKELVLLHPERSVVPGTTREWLKPRPWVSAHHHIEMPGLKRPTATSTASTTTSSGDPRPVKALRSLKQRLETRIGRVKSQAPTATSRPPHLTDFARLARRLCGTSIGLVLGGGGARGSAHIGALRALEERGVPIDLVGGTSIGSFVGGLYARDGAAVSSHGRAKRFAGRMASLWRFITDATYPLVSYTTGHEFNRGIFKCFADTHIEDMWLPFFCNTTNITWSRMEVHFSGYAWRYIRGSMTLAGLVPPLIDEGNMLVDGGYTDNLPVSIMLAMGARNVIAVDVGGIDDTSPQHYGDTLSGWWVLLNRFNPWSSMRNIPSIPDIQTRLTYTTSVKMLEEVKSLESCLYLRMPVEQYGTLEFGRLRHYDRSNQGMGIN
ncbi:hypothetical protein MYAM1_000234 [Malassezia yamatoensis]|uniref:Lysophospholipase NTE1 n=1 Tax=Malassezia yamatoensis TaxID=253288 RepID=A0AAJ5YQV2_9BASI|nr:hypothetical protein MYAM1_000234 [Malassezia yamatoensis]